MQVRGNLITSVFIQVFNVVKHSFNEDFIVKPKPVGKQSIQLVSMHQSEQVIIFQNVKRFPTNAES